MGTDSTKQLANAADATLFLGEDWFDPLEAGVRGRIRGFIEEILEGELDEALSRRRYQRRLGEPADRAEEAVERGHRHGPTSSTRPPDMIRTSKTLDWPRPHGRNGD
jgi:hypothetical protein